MSGDIEIRQLRDGDLEALRACLNIAFHDHTSAESMTKWLGLIGERTAVAYDADGRVVGTSGAFGRPLSVPGGGELGCAGVTIVTVLPTHRRRGLLTRMMGTLLDQARAKGEPLAGLWAAEGGIYGRFGYGVASRVAQVELPGGSGPLAQPPTGDYTLELVPTATAAPLLEPVWRALRAARAGVPDRSRAWWEDDILYDPEEGREGAREKRVVVARAVDGAPAAYAIYRARGAEPQATLEVLELVGRDPDAEAALWTYVRSVDLVSTITAKDRALDDPLPLRLANPRDVQVKEVGDALWLRILDVPAAVAGRTWSAPADLTVRVTGDEGGTWRLETSAEGDGRATPTDAAPDLTLDHPALGALYLGGTSPVQLLDAARLVEHTPGAAERLADAARTPRLPWTPDHF